MAFACDNPIASFFLPKYSHPDLWYMWSLEEMNTVYSDEANTGDVVPGTFGPRADGGRDESFFDLSAGALGLPAEPDWSVAGS